MQVVTASPIAFPVSMTESADIDRQLIERIRAGDQQGWPDLIARYEGRLLAYVRQRLPSQAVAEDVVQETFIGFLLALPNFDIERPLENFLFTIAAYKLTDHLRREGRRPRIPFSSTEKNGESTGFDPKGNARVASSLFRSQERRELEEKALCEALEEVLGRWRERGDWGKVQCVELLFSRGRTNKEAAALLRMTEQKVAGIKFDFLGKLRAALRGMTLNRDCFPELYETPEDSR
jgi:RNA polymerase sigma-70 factor (ECF subfamily)